jgi:hypothetical protein
MDDQETTSRLGHGLQIRQPKPGRRINCLALGDGLRDGRSTRSVIN